VRACVRMRHHRPLYLFTRRTLQLQTRGCAGWVSPPRSRPHQACLASWGSASTIAPGVRERTRSFT
jgi:hypothetical protein